MTRAPEIGFSETTSEERPHYEKPTYQARPGKSSGATKARASRAQPRPDKEAGAVSPAHLPPVVKTGAFRRR